MKFELTVLGSSSALPTSTKFPSAHVLNVHERFFLIDCGEGTQIQLRRSKIGFGKIDHIFISHLHGDHIFGLYGILSTFQLLNRTKGLRIYGPTGTDRFVDFFLQNFGNELPYAIDIQLITKRAEQLVFEDSVVEVWSFPLKHRVPAFGYLFREKPRPLNILKDALETYRPGVKQIREIKNGADLQLENGGFIPNEKLTEPPYKQRSFAYCTDTMFYERNIPFLTGVDLLYHEATFAKADKKLAKITGHSTTEQAATFAARANASQLLLGHFSSRYKKPDNLLDEALEIFSNTEIATELKTYSIEPERIKR